MIISYAHNFIFIKTRKTAGSSMEIALSSHAGSDDVVTPLGFDQDSQRYQMYPGLLPQNFSSDKSLEKAFGEAIESGNQRQMRKIFREQMRSSDLLGARRHGSATLAREIAGDQFWNSAFKFTVERHPYEKAVSFAWFRAERNGDFEQALKEILEIGVYRNFDLYTIDGKKAVDYIIRYEQFDKDVPQVEEMIGGLPILSRLARANAHQRKDRRSAREILTAEQKTQIQETCREEFELLGYER